jgi:hypothetical protein
MNVKLYWESIIEYLKEEEWSLYEVNDEAVDQPWSDQAKILKLNYKHSIKGGK